jgi:hypothetical protein
MTRPKVCVSLFIPWILYASLLACGMHVLTLGHAPDDRSVRVQQPSTLLTLSCMFVCVRVQSYLNLTMSDDIRKLIEDMEKIRDLDPLKSINVSALMPPLSKEIQESVERARQEMQNENNSTKR